MHENKQLHLVRHGEVYNPQGVLYGRLPGFQLSDNGKIMAEMAASYLQSLNREFSLLVVSPLKRTKESAESIAKFTGLEMNLDDRIIEPENVFEGKVHNGKDAAYKKPENWRHLINPFSPSWGEKYTNILHRMLNAMHDAFESSEKDVILVSHQLPITMVQRHVAAKKLFHNPSNRRCELSSVTSVSLIDNKWQEVAYAHPAAKIVDKAFDIGAV